MTAVKAKHNVDVLEKCPTGIKGLDEITKGGLPRGRPTLICGSAGCGKTLFAMEFLMRGAMDYGEPGVFMTFEETPEDLAKNFISLGFNLPDMISRGLIATDHVVIERSEIEETGEYDLEGLFIRLETAIDSIGAKRVVLDTIEVLFSGLSNAGIIRAELRRLFHWLKDRGVTAIVTGERGDKMLTRYGLEEYVADCVILLDFRIDEQLSTRRLRIVKYRGSSHGSDEYPFLIDEGGLSILPITSLGLDYPVSKERIATGVPKLDTMLDGKGFYRGSTILVSGTAGTGKTSLSATFADAACLRGERCLYFAFEESPSQIIRNMGSIGLDLTRWVKKGLLKFYSARPSLYGLEMHLLTFHKVIEEFDPQVFIVDPISNLSSAGTAAEVKSILTRLIDFTKMKKISTFLTDLTHFTGSLEHTSEEISSLIDTWLLLRDIELNGERNRGLYILKSRGMAHSNQIQEFLLTNHGISLIDIYTGSGEILTGSARATQKAEEKASELARRFEVDSKLREQERKRKVLEEKIAAIRAEFDAESEELYLIAEEEKKRQAVLSEDRLEMAHLRKGNPSDSKAKRPKKKGERSVR
ncbi:KaiC family protein [Desulfobacterium sp. N47]|uniref:non-specific serine/threonine protein kinase n=1 Tax=uncultured Desulfobacterium sp. TaxID=201089 RepID=E1YH23_9BACT|nr:KaiC-like protein 1 [uncultured Desulfobacterium sp.]